MKKVVLVAAVAMLSLASCKKDYTCECTTASGIKTSTVFKDAKSSEAEDACSTLSTLSSISGGSCEIK